MKTASEQTQTLWLQTNTLCPQTYKSHLFGRGIKIPQPAQFVSKSRDNTPQLVTLNQITLVFKYLYVQVEWLVLYNLRVLNTFCQILWSDLAQWLLVAQDSRCFAMT